MQHIKTISTALFLLAINFANTQKTVFVIEAKRLKATSGYVLATQEMNSIKKVFSTELKADQEKLKQKFSKLLEPYKFADGTTQDQILARLNDVEKKKMELLLEESQLQGKQAKAKDEEYQALYQHKVGCILDKINTAVKTYCTHNKIEVLYKLDVLQQAVAYYNEKHDITEELITKVR